MPAAKILDAVFAIAVRNDDFFSLLQYLEYCRRYIGNVKHVYIEAAPPVQA